MDPCSSGSDGQVRKTGCRHVVPTLCGGRPLYVSSGRSALRYPALDSTISRSSLTVAPGRFGRIQGLLQFHAPPASDMSPAGTLPDRSVCPATSGEDYLQQALNTKGDSARCRWHGTPGLPPPLAARSKAVRRPAQRMRAGLDPTSECAKTEPLPARLCNAPMS